MEKKNPEISVALVTRNRTAELTRCLRSLHSGTAMPSEVLISDDSDSAVAPKVRAIAQHFRCSYLSGPKRGLYANRNFAAQNVSGTHVRTMDDDHEFPPDHWERVQETVATDQDAIWVIGEFYRWDQVQRPFPPVPEIQPRGFSLPPTSCQNSMAIADGATIYPRQVLLENPMIERFPFGNGYLEFGARLHARGYRIRQLESTYVLHHYCGEQRSFALPKVQIQTAFLAAALAYGVYRPSWSAKIECWSYFLLRALANAIPCPPAWLRKNCFSFSDLREAVRLYRHYRDLFRAGLWQQFR